MKQKQRERTYGYHGTSIGSSRSRKRSPQTTSAMRMEAGEKQRKRRMESLLKGHSVGDKRRTMERERNAPKHKKHEHKHPGARPTIRPIKKDPELESRLQRAGTSDSTEWERRQAATRAKYASMPATRYSAEEEARLETTRKEYSLDIRTAHC